MVSLMHACMHACMHAYETTFKPTAMIELRKLETTYLQLCARLAWTAIPFFVANELNE